ncbi:MAG: TIGR04283 family arsenosugar biosynthesis glycosyltransferase [Defluviitaleaceae bacterium]|nr:TIGR04283 family arsenosugar biosynthesis glycosyltransferase [Defluviitaleaceae bacterium]
MDKRVSIIIPVYNESKGIGALLSVLAPLQSRCEILFVDGGSGDDTVNLLEERGDVVIRSPKGRANQMNHGATAASGEILWFLHADSIPPKDAVSQIHEVLGEGYRIGCFPIKFSGNHPFMRIHAFLSNNLRTRILNIAFGDQGIFLHRSLFEELGGYAPIPLMEDYKLSMDARKAGYSIGMAKGKIITSDRRYQANGRLKTMWRMQMLQRRFRRGDNIDEIAKAYNSMRRNGVSSNNKASQ